MNTRVKIVTELAGLISKVKQTYPVRVGIDGVDCSGKTMLGNELAEILGASQREVIRISIEGFHNPREIRYRKGRFSPQGFYEDTFNHGAIISCILKPLGPGGDLFYKKRQFDFRSNSSVDGNWEKSSPNSIVLFDGIFLHRPELIEFWDFTIFIDVEFGETIRRARERDRYLFGTAEEVEKIYRDRYIPGQNIYLHSAEPASKANVVFYNNDIQYPSFELTSK